MTRTDVCCLMILLTLAAASAQEPVPQGNDFQVNTLTDGFQDGAAVAVTPAGDLFVVWQSQDSAGGDADFSIQGRRFASDGSPIGAEFQVNSYGTGDQLWPSVALDASGRAAVVWMSNGSGDSDTSGWSIQGRRFEADGLPSGDDFQVNSITAGYQTFPTVAMGAAGDFVVSWNSWSSSGSDSDYTSVQARRFAATGMPLGAEFQVNTYTTGYQYYPQVGISSGSAFVVVWQSDGSSGTDGAETSIQGQRFAGDGTRLGGEFQVNGFTPSIQFYPAITVAEDGRFVVVWASYAASPGPDTSGWSIQGRRFAASGTPLGDDFQVNSYTTGDQLYTKVGMGPDAAFLVVWDSLGSAGSDNDGESIQGQQFGWDGTRVGGQFQVNSFTAAKQYNPKVAADSMGRFVTVWSSYASAGGDTDLTSVQARRFRSTRIFADRFETGDVSAWSRSVP